MPPAIRVENLSKRYRIGARTGDYRTLREELGATLLAPFRRAAAGLRPRPEDQEFWALRDVSFDVEPGEVVGIIGRNGAGKSTLLKILSRITEPTSGRAVLRGRVASLLEVGTGFHPELTGRENIYLNGSILGMTRREISRKFDEIVDFSGIDQFLDTPVKRYSSGMYVRLAFAVAAHLEPEILVVDEVLAVGDASFQKKCLGKISEIAGQGRTVLFVSHNMAAVTRLCERAILLNEGTIKRDGSSAAITGEYLRLGVGTSTEREWPTLENAPGNDIVRLRAARLRTEALQADGAVDIRRPITIEIEFDVLQPGHLLVPNPVLTNQEGILICHLHDSDPNWRRRYRLVGRYISRALIPGNFLSEGLLIVGIAISTHDPVIVHLHESEALAIQIIDTLDGDSARGDYAGNMPGVIRPLLDWTTDFIPANHTRANAESIISGDPISGTDATRDSVIP